MKSTQVPAVIDTGVMVECARGHPPATTFFVLMNRNHRVRFSRLSAAELVSRCHTDSERTLALRFISLSVIIELTDAIAQRAVDILTAVPLPTALTAADAIIAATAIEHSLPLYTLDPARFAAVPGLATAQPY